MKYDDDLMMMIICIWEADWDKILSDQWSVIILIMKSWNHDHRLIKKTQILELLEELVFDEWLF
jgi:hypothetical protein